VDRVEWLKQRQLGIGSSDCPPIMGESPYSTMVDIYDSKVALEVVEKSSWVMDKGNTLEPIARARYELLNNADFPPAMFVHVQKPHYRCNVDGYSKELDKVIEIKWCGAKFTDKVPSKYKAQVQYQYMVTNCKELEMVQIDNMNRINVIPVERDDEYIARLIDKVDWFWDCVINKRRDEVLNEYEKLNQANNGKRRKKAPSKHR